MSVNHLEHRGEVSVGMIAGHLHVSGAFVTSETGKLLKLGFLTKRPDPKDRRPGLSERHPERGATFSKRWPRRK